MVRVRMVQINLRALLQLAVVAVILYQVRLPPQVLSSVHPARACASILSREKAGINDVATSCIDVSRMSGMCVCRAPALEFPEASSAPEEH